MGNNNLYPSFVRLHILHHACAGPVFGLWIIEELARHGYRLGPGTLYPILHSLEGGGYLASQHQLVGGRVRRVYSITPEGRAALDAAKVKVRELFSELWEEPPV
ncbi:MAG: helix-turn-helix transcriptional regulator [Chloroflexi bacterium]|nr:helix-turn-helix transcriptional regulator [Chloroflexota bacterium]